MIDESYYRRIPAYEDGGKKVPPVLPQELGYTPGTPEYYQRQAQISGRAEVVQPEAYITPAGYVKDAVNFVEDLTNGNYSGAVVDALLNVIPWGAGKTLKSLKKKLSKANGVSQDFSSYAEPFTPTMDKKTKKRVLKEMGYDNEFNEYLPRQINANKYDKEISAVIDDAVFPDDETRKLISQIDKDYGTNYKGAYNKIAFKDMSNRGEYIKWKQLENNNLGKITTHTTSNGRAPSNIDDYTIFMDLDQYIPGTANHEMGHLADGLAGSNTVSVLGRENKYVTNSYLNYLVDASNTRAPERLRRDGMYDAANSVGYLLDPMEAKSHMLTLKRALKESGDIKKWSDPVTEDMVLNYFKRPDRNKMVRNQYDLYLNKNNYIERLNRLIPMEIVTPVGAAGLAGYNLIEEEKK